MFPQPVCCGGTAVSPASPGLAAVLFSGIDAVDLYRGARTWPLAAILSLGLAGSLAFERSRAARYASIAAALVGVLVLFIGSITFLDRFANDPFIPPAKPIVLRTLTTHALAEFRGPGDVTNLWLSPSGAFVAFASDDQNEKTTIHAGRAGGPLATFLADEAMFVGEGRLLLLERQRSDSVLRVVDLDRSKDEVWSQRVPLSATRLSFDPRSGTWRLLGWNDSREIVSASGRLDSPVIRETRWSPPADGTGSVDVLAASRNEVLTVEMRYPFTPGWASLRLWMAFLNPDIHPQSRLWTVGERERTMFATSGLDVRCHSMSPDGESATCTSFDGNRTGFFVVDATKRTMTGLASVNGRFFSRGDGGRGWVAEWWDSAAVLIRPATREAIRVAGTAYQLAIADRLVGAVSIDQQGSTVRLYAME